MIVSVMMKKDEDDAENTKNFCNADESNAAHNRSSSYSHGDDIEYDDEEG